MKRTVLAMVVGMLLVGPALAQNVTVGGDQQQRNTEQTIRKTKKFDPVTGKEIGEDTVSTNKNLPATGNYEYSGLPCKWRRGQGGGGGGGQEKEKEKK